MEKDEVLEIFIPLGSFDKSRLRILDPVSHSFTRGDSEIEWCTSEGRYVDDHGVERELYFQLPEQFSFGTNASYPINTSKEDKEPDNRIGYQVCYPITSMKTTENPTKVELYAQYILDSLADVTWDKLVEQCDESIDPEDRKVPNPTYNSYLGARRGDSFNRSAAVKPPYAFPMTIPKGQKKKVVDRSKPQRSYIKLITKGTGRSLRCITSIYGPGDKKESPVRYLEVRGRITPVVKWCGVFWGSHGQISSHGASIRLRISEMNFTPITDGGPKTRMLSPNTSIPEEDSDSDNEKEVAYNKSYDDDDDDEDECFVKPTDDDNASDMLGTSKTSDENYEIEEPVNKKEEPPKKKTKVSSKRRDLIEKKRNKSNV
jgi:hypothetical protein